MCCVVDLSEAPKHAAANCPIYPDPQDRHSCLSILFHLQLCV
jgi:hypothetical protein